MKSADSVLQQNVLGYDTHRLLLQPSIGELFEEVQAFEMTSSADYTNFVYDSHSQRHASEKCLFVHRDSEYAEPYGKLVIDKHSGNAVAFLAVLDGKQLKERRVRSLMRLRRERLIAAGSAVYHRFVQAGSVFSKVKDNDLYLSRLAVAPDYRRVGLARYLLSAVEQTCRDLDLHRLLLDVSDNAQSALRLYRTTHFTETGSSSVTDDATGKKLKYRHFVKVISA